MHVLDVGSGLGDVALLVAELVGPSGAVVGIDTNPSSLETARDRARAAGLGHVSFRTGEIASLELGEEFDAVVGRCILFFLRDPVAVLRRLVGYVRSGGLIAFQEPGNATLQPVSVPLSPLLDQLWGWIMQTYRHADLDLSMGLHLFRLFGEASLPAPRCIWTGPSVEGQSGPATTTWLASSTRSCRGLCSSGSPPPRRSGSTHLPSGCGPRSSASKAS